jgi:serine/threonine protein kinase
VYKAKHRDTDRPVVIKVIEKSAVVAEDLKHQLQREIEVHSRLVHPHIVRMYAYFQDANRGAWRGRSGEARGR